MYFSLQSDQKTRGVQTDSWKLVWLQKWKCWSYTTSNLVPELQGEPTEVATEKARLAFQKAQKPVLV